MRFRSLTRATQPAVEPVTLTEAKNHLRVDSDDDNAYIMALVQAAREWVEQYLDRTLVDTQWTMRLDQFPDDGTDPIELPRPPMATLPAHTAVAVTYTLESGATAAMSVNEFRVDRHATPGSIMPLYSSAWPVHRHDDNSVTVTWWGGYGEDGSKVPASIKSAMLMLVGHWYEQRGAVLATGAMPQEIEFGVKALLDSQRWGSYT